MTNTIKIAVTINSRIEKVWDVFMNPDSLKHWLPGFISMEHLEGTIGKTGSRNKLKIREHGKEHEVVEKVLFVNPRQQYTFEIEQDTLKILVDVRFISIGQVTEIIQAIQYSPKTILMQLFRPLLKGLMKKKMKNDLIKFKEFVESQN